MAKVNPDKYNAREVLKAYNSGINAPAGTSNHKLVKTSKLPNTPLVYQIWKADKYPDQKVYCVTFLWVHTDGRIEDCWRYARCFKTLDEAQRYAKHIGNSFREAPRRRED